MTGLAAGVHVEPLADWDVEQDIDLVLAFLNTCDVEHGTDTLSAEDTWRTWALGRDLGPPPTSARARPVRDALRATVAGDDPTGTTSWSVRIDLLEGVPMLTAADALGTVLAAAYRLVLTGHWARIKICPAEDCRWAFYDRSRNRSRTWCSMRVCGNREKARNWRERARSATAR
ncbi:CGNR zinc finger domain-containing protein [Streptoalloteichus hindustanus]|uniref:CGNR zinc finger domain-containing protein n=1 Tax=Streptoalloteichus hindustanus TaxID=2017 RepID=A0A1M4U326_STRHI|nr:CGNR zinc finger domain-containing protein [Streptoalloteichus hindustanus]SHE50927.1 CGNR zinc finger domain-containing protein [Streptoalloteichus hindustanus]